MIYQQLSLFAYVLMMERGSTSTTVIAKQTNPIVVRVTEIFAYYKRFVAKLEVRINRLSIQMRQEF